MYIYRIEFSYTGAKAPDNCSDLADSYLSSLYRNSQTWGENLPLYREQNRYVALVVVPESDSLDDRHHSEWVRKDVARLSEHGIGISYRLHAELPESVECCRCSAPSAYVLYTVWMGVTSPAHCLDCFAPVPLYKFPTIRSGEYGDVLSWVSDYQACDALYMGSSVLEKTAMRQLSELGSKLTKNGMKACKDLAKLSGKPFYYYLSQHDGVDCASERARRCPSCGEHWLLDQTLHSFFDFRCDDCRLLSNIAFDVRPGCGT